MNRFSRALLAGMGGLCFITGTTAALMEKVDAASLHGNRYAVHSSDTLWGISRCYGLSVGTLKQLNDLRTNTIYVGELLKLPGHGSFHLSHRRANASVPAPHIPGLPSRLIPVYEAAARPYHVPWTVLAAIHKTETDFATSHCPESTAGAKGPFQFMPSTFRAYAVKAPGHRGTPNIQNLSDAASTAAHMLAQDGFSKNPQAAIYDYNHSSYYVHQILSLAGLKIREDA